MSAIINILKKLRVYSECFSVRLVSFLFAAKLSEYLTETEECLNKFRSQTNGLAKCRFGLHAFIHHEQHHSQSEMSLCHFGLQRNGLALRLCCFPQATKLS